MNQTASIAAEVIAELSASQPPTHAPTMGALAKLRYSHIDAIDFIIANPGCTQKTLALRYGYSESWISNIMASDAWHVQMAKRREELVDPVLAASLYERFHALADLSLTRLMEKLEKPVVSDNVVLRAVELGARATGRIGSTNSNAQPPAAEADHLARLANRLLDLQGGIRARLEQGTTIDVTPQGDAV